MNFFKDKESFPKLTVVSTAKSTNVAKPLLQSKTVQKTKFGEKSHNGFMQKRQDYHVDILYSLYFAKNKKETQS